jgi:hypothetical protein
LIPFVTPMLGFVDTAGSVTLNTRVPRGDMQGGSDRRSLAGDMQSGTDVRRTRETS